MTDANEVTAKPAAAATAANEDLSAEIAATVPRGPHEQVTCRRVNDNHYRCNWWLPEMTSGYDNPLMQGLMVTTNRICQSQFLRVTRTGRDLKIVILSK